MNTNIIEQSKLAPKLSRCYFFRLCLNVKFKGLLYIDAGWLLLRKGSVFERPSCDTKEGVMSHSKFIFPEETYTLVQANQC